jgi:hypothetical protein
MGEKREGVCQKKEITLLTILTVLQITTNYNWLRILVTLGLFPVDTLFKDALGSPL